MLQSAEGDLRDDEQAVIERFDALRARFVDAMEDDFNTADAMSVVFDLVREINTSCAVGGCASKALCEKALALFDELTGVLGVTYERGGDDNLDAEIEALIEQRQAARKARNFAEADRIRDQLKDAGIILEDTPQGVKWHRA
ncbi:MAG: hypothetical protein IJC18_05790 [Clostridia bacterium]|nr:hypothetical protein [Clostridia bacterium]